MKTFSMVGFLRMDLPSETIRLCDGAYMYFGGDLYTSKHDLFGTLAGLQAISEGAGEEVPSMEMIFLPTSAATPADLCQPGFQKSRVRLWLGEYTPATNTLVGTPHLMFDGQLDQTKYIVGRTSKRLSMSVVSTAERLFERNAGNSMSPSFQKSIWPGEKGHDNATGLSRPVAWGAQAPPSSPILTGVGRLIPYMNGMKR